MRVAATQRALARVVPSSCGDFRILETKEQFMKQIQLGTNFAIFVLFFGIATLEAFQTRNWMKALFWLAIAVVFLVSDNLSAGKRRAQ